MGSTIWLIEEELYNGGTPTLGVAATEETAKMVAEAYVKDHNLDKVEGWYGGELKMWGSGQYISICEEKVI